MIISNILFEYLVNLLPLNLFLIFPSEPTRILKQPEYKVVQRGRSVVFECKVKHDPTLTPTITWLKDAGELPDDERSALRGWLTPAPLAYVCSPAAENNLYKLSVSRFILESDSLTITDVTENDAGVYTCITNTTLDQDSASAELTVVGEFSSQELVLTDSEHSCRARCLSAFQA